MRAVMFASAAASAGLMALVVSCSHGDYDGSFQGTFDGGARDGASEGGALSISRDVQPDKTETIATSDNVFVVTIAAGTFLSPATVTLTAQPERTLDNSLIVPVYEVRSTEEPKKPIQVAFQGTAQPNNLNKQSDRALVAAIQSGSAFSPLPIVGSSNGTQTGSYWGLSKTFGTFSLELLGGAGGGSAFVDTPSSCTAACCGAKGAAAAGFAGGCYCATAPDHACFLEHCPNLDVAAARCTGIAASANLGTIACTAFGAQCPGSGCGGSYPGNGFCTTSVITGPGSGGGPQACCVTPPHSGMCANSPQLCSGFAVRCTAKNGCPTGTSCCVFDDESYCAKDCPPARRACSVDQDCSDAGADAGKCRGGGCPVGVCGALPAGCLP